MTLKTQDIHHSSSFPSILDSYLNSEHLGKVVPVAKAVPQMKRDQRVRRPVSAAELHKRKALLDQRHLVSYQRLHRLKDRLTQQYAKLLREKVRKQRQEIKQCNLKLRERRKPQTPRGLSLKELVGSNLKDNAAFLKSLPKTRFHLILELQKQLGQCGCLQGIREQEVFKSWVDQSKTKQLEKQLQEMELYSKSAPEMKLDDLLKKKLKVLPKIQSSLAESEQQGHTGAFSESDGGGVQVSSAVVHSKQIQEQDESQLRFRSVFLQELPVPNFSTLQPGFSEALRTNIVPLTTDEPLHKSKTASKIEHKLRLMHGLSLFNMAQSRILLTKNGLMQYDKEYIIQDMMDHECLNTFLTKEQTCCCDPQLPAEPLRNHATTPHLTSCIQEEINLQADQISSSEVNKMVQNPCDKGNINKVPLCMEDVDCPCISLAKTFDTMWSNYA